MPDLLSLRVADRYLSARVASSEPTAVAPPGWENTVKEMKKDKGIDNPWALAWSMKNKGDHPGGKEASSFTKAYYQLVEVLKDLRDNHHMDPQRIAMQALVTLKLDGRKD